MVSGALVSVSWNRSTRLLPESTTYTSSAEEMATPDGRVNWPLPLPAVPHLVMKVPIGRNFCTRLLVGSTTITLSEGPMARSSVVVVVAPNCPSPVPRLPHLVMKLPVGVNFWIRLLPESAT